MVKLGKNPISVVEIHGKFNEEESNFMYKSQIDIYKDRIGFINLGFRTTMMVEPIILNLGVFKKWKFEKIGKCWVLFHMMTST
jgi:hypothetical protein